MDPDNAATPESDLPRRSSSTDLHDPQQRVEVERALSEVPEVLGARIVPGYEREVDELHVLTTLARAPKQTVRDMQTLLMARFGVTTDHRVVSVVQIDQPQGWAGPPRVHIERVATSQADVTVSVEVAIHDGDELHTATDAGPATATGQRRAAARATLEALRPLLDADEAVELDGTDVISMQGHAVAITLVHFGTRRGEHTVSGSALVRSSEPDAVARSVLDALNRTISACARS